MAASPLGNAERQPGTDSAPDRPPTGSRREFLAGLRARCGAEIGTSAWITVDQARIDRFAQATGDHQFVHVDPLRAAAETPFGGTVAHGYLTLSMLGGAVGEIMPPHPAVRAVLNLGADKVRFLAPVRAGARTRARFTLDGVTALPDDRAALRLGARVEVAREDADAPRPVLRAELTLLIVFATTPDTDAVVMPGGQD